MIIQDKNTATGDLSYFETTLLLYLKESHPHIAGDKEVVRMRADEAAGSYERAIRAARKTGGFLPESITARRNSIQQISHR